MSVQNFKNWPVWIFFCLFIIPALVSCEKVIDINLNKINPKIVIEGNFSDRRGECRVVVSQSINFSDTNQFPGVVDATISIREGQNTPVNLIQTSPGVYVSDTMRARPLHTYTLSVKVGEQEFSSTVKVPQKVPFDSLYIDNFTGFGNTRKFASVIFKDIEGPGNAYRFLLYKNGLENSNIFILNDDYSDGRVINTFLAFFDNSDNQRLDVGDTVTVEMQGIAPSVYTFFLSLSQSSTGGNDSVAPGNPVSNIEGGALGYFNAYIKQRKTVIVPI